MYHRKSFLNGWLTGLSLASLTFSVMFVPVMSVAQRNPGDRTGGGRDSVAPRRDDAAPRRDYSPPPSRREDSAPPPRREDSPPRREIPPPPPPRREEPPRRDYSPPPREYAPPPRREDPPSRREQPPARRDEPPARREDSTPRREDPGARREERGAAPGFGDRTGANRTENERRFNRDGNNGGVLEPERPGIEPRRPAQDRNSRPDRAPDRADSERRLNRDGNNAGVLEPAPQRRDPGGRPGFNPGDRTGRDRNADRNDTSDGAADRLRRGENRVNPGLDRQEREDSSLSTTRNRARDIFTRSVEGRHYENGLTLRGGVRVYHNNLRVYFRNDYCHYPFYSPTYDYGYVYYSPYYVYYGVCPPYIYRRHAYYRPPTVIYIEIPIYSGNYWRGYRNTYDDDYYLYRDYARDRQVDQAVREIEEAFRYCDIERLVYVTDPRTRIAIFRKGRYDYSLDANDYLDITRDFMRSIDTLEFDIYRVRRVSSSVYVASAKHIYRDHANRRRTVYLSFALERPYGRWVISQVDTSPEYIEE